MFPGQLNITEKVRTIGEDAFAGCLEITSVTVPPKTTLIKSGAFRDCANLSTVTIPVTTIVEKDAFAGCGCNVTLFKAGAQLCDCAAGQCSPTYAPTAAPTLNPANKGHRHQHIPKWEVSLIVRVSRVLPLCAVAFG